MRSMFAVGVLLCFAFCDAVSIAQADSGFPIQLFGNFHEYFMYYTKIAVGNPSRIFTVVVDTGSADLLIPKIGCDTCAGGDSTQYYNSTASRTSKVVSCTADKTLKCTKCLNGQCGYTMEYVGIAEDAVVFNDFVNFQPVQQAQLLTRVNFGAIYNISMSPSAAVTNGISQLPAAMKAKRANNARDGDSDDGYPEGVWGLGFRQLNSLNTSTVLDALYSSRLVTRDVFSMCLTQQGGMMMLGGIGKWHSAPIQYTPIVEHYFYSVHLTDLRINGHSINIDQKILNSKYCIVDSGTVMPTFTAEVYSKIRSIFTSYCSTVPLVGICTGVVAPNATLFDKQCFAMTQHDILQFPTMQLVLKNVNGGEVVLNYPATQYLQPQYFCDKAGTYGLGLDQDEDFTILGAELLQGYHTIYDRQQSRMGFAPVANCAPST